MKRTAAHLQQFLGHLPHLSHIFRKLAVRDRHSAAAVAGSLNLSPA